MKPETNDSVLQLLVFGVMLAIFKVVYLFFDQYNIMDVAAFLTAGFLLGGKVPATRKALGLLLALPAFALCLLLAIRMGYNNIIDGVGTSNAISLLVIPLATMTGIFIYAKRAARKSVLKK